MTGPLTYGILKRILLGFSPDGSHALIQAVDDTVHYVAIKTGETIKILKGHTSLLTSAAFSPNGKSVLTGSHDKTALLWDLTQEGKEIAPKKILKTERNQRTVIDVALSPDSNYALTANPEIVFLWDLNSGENIATYQNARPDVSNSVSFTASGKYALIGAQTVVLWGFSKVPLQEVVLLMKVEQLGKEKVMQDPYFADIYNKLLD